MTQKILYAVQSKQIEDVISRSLTAQTNGGIVSVGSAGYREQVLPSLKQDRKSTRLNSSHSGESRMPSSA